MGNWLRGLTPGRALLMFIGAIVALAACAYLGGRT